MQYGLNEEQEMIAASVRAFVESEIYPHEELVERTGEVPQEIADESKRKTTKLGFYACNLPESVGGAGLSHLEFALVERELGRSSMALNHFFDRPQNILMACEGEQIERYLLPAMRCTVNSGFAVMNEWLYATRITVAAMSVGRARRVFDFALEYAATRVPFGQKIGRFQGVGFQLADMIIESDAADMLMLAATDL